MQQAFNRHCSLYILHCPPRPFTGYIIAMLTRNRYLFYTIPAITFCYIKSSSHLSSGNILKIQQTTDHQSCAHEFSLYACKVIVISHAAAKTIAPAAKTIGAMLVMKAYCCYNNSIDCNGVAAMMRSLKHAATSLFAIDIFDNLGSTKR